MASGLFGWGGGLSKDTFGDVAGAVGDLFAAEGARAKAAGDRIEGQNYGLAAELAEKNVAFTKMSTEIKEFQQSRTVAQTIGEQRADVAAAGFGDSGSSLDLLRDSASQGALAHAVIQEQGLITEAGYEEQAQSYRNMQVAANMAADAEDKAATGLDITAAIKGVAAFATLL
jgi:hypothetical protein